MKNLLSLIIDAAKNDDMNRVIELAENQQDKFCDNNCVWTDHHPKCVRAEPEWYHVIDVHGCNRFYHRTEDCPYKVKTPLYTTPQPKQEQGEQLARLGWQEIDCPICGGGARAFPKQKQELWGSSLITNPDFVEEQKKKTQQLYEMLGEQEQVEPVGKFAKFTDGIWREVTDGSSGVPLYTHSKEWVGLTKKDMSEFASKTPNWEELCYLVETKLKNKNT